MDSYSKNTNENINNIDAGLNDETDDNNDDETDSNNDDIDSDNETDSNNENNYQIIMNDVYNTFNYNNNVIEYRYVNNYILPCEENEITNEYDTYNEIINEDNEIINEDNEECEDDADNEECEDDADNEECEDEEDNEECEDNEIVNENNNIVNNNIIINNEITNEEIYNMFINLDPLTTYGMLLLNNNITNIDILNIDNKMEYVEECLNYCNDENEASCYAAYSTAADEWRNEVSGAVTLVQSP